MIKPKGSFNGIPIYEVNDELWNDPDFIADQKANKLAWRKHRLLGKIQGQLYKVLHLYREGAFCNPTTRPTVFNGYLARNGYYYNGYITSPDYLEDAFEPPVRRKRR